MKGTFDINHPLYVIHTEKRPFTRLGERAFLRKQDYTSMLDELEEKGLPTSDLRALKKPFPSLFIQDFAIAQGIDFDKHQKPIYLSDDADSIKKYVALCCNVADSSFEESTSLIFNVNHNDAVRNAIDGLESYLDREIKQYDLTSPEFISLDKVSDKRYFAIGPNF